MKIATLSAIVAPLLIAVSGIARADGMPSDSPVALSTASRAEVIADLQTWQRAGLDTLSAGEAGADVFSTRYLTAQANYEQLRAAPEFAMLVARIARQRGEGVRIAGE